MGRHALSEHGRHQRRGGQGNRALREPELHAAATREGTRMSTLVSRQAYSRAARARRGWPGRFYPGIHRRRGRCSGSLGGSRFRDQEELSESMSAEIPWSLPRDGVVKFHRSDRHLVAGRCPDRRTGVSVQRAADTMPMPTPTPPPSPSTPTPPPSPPSLPVDPANVVFLPTPAAAPFSRRIQSSGAIRSRSLPARVRDQDAGRFPITRSAGPTRRTSTTSEAVTP